MAEETYAKHNRAQRKKPTQTAAEAPVCLCGPPGTKPLTLKQKSQRLPSLVCLCGPPSTQLLMLRQKLQRLPFHGVSLRTAEDQTVTQAEVAAPTDTADTITYGGRVFINLSGPRDSWPEPPSDEEAPAAPAQISVSEELLSDTMAHRQKIANQHGLLWGTVSGDSRYSIVDAIQHQRPPMKLFSVKKYLAELKDGQMPHGKQVFPLIEQFVFLMLSIDLQPYQRRGADVYKACLPKAKLKKLVEAFFVSNLEAHPV